jgi:DNA-binding transcriptional regulator YiaG
MAAKTTQKPATSAAAAPSIRVGNIRPAITGLEKAAGAFGTPMHLKPSQSSPDVMEISTSPSEEALADELIERAGDPSDVKQLCDRYGLRREDLGRLTGFSLRALADWSTGKLPSEPAKRRLHEIRRLLDSLAEVVKVDAICSWLKTRNPACENMTPMQVIEVGEIDRLWQMVYALGSDSLE